MGIKTAYVVLIGLALASCSPYARIQKSNDYNKKLAYANKMYDAGKYNKAQLLYDQIKDVFKGTAQYEDLFYRYTYTYYKMEDYESAAFYFKNFVQLFPNSPKALEMDYMQAYCFYRLSPRVELDQSNTIKAISAMQTFINIHAGSDKVAEANRIIDECRKKLEKKAYNAAALYYDMGLYKAAGVSYTNLMLDYPDSDNSDRYKFLAIRAYYRYAENSIPARQRERYEDVVSAYLDLVDRYPDSRYLKEAENYYKSSQEHIKSLQNGETEKKPKQQHKPAVGDPQPANYQG